MSSDRAWYLIYTKPNLENSADENLQRQGFATYLPRVEQRRRRNGRYITRIEAFFPRYLFIHLNADSDNWSPIRSTIGVANIVRFGGLPVAVPANLIASLRQNDDQYGVQRVVQKLMQPGDKVAIIDGPFAGYSAIYNKQKSADRIAVLLNIIGKNTELTLSAHSLMPAQAAINSRP
jgi:transcriptional antiterminator RfaH